ncbi:hypothetical protein AB0758_46545 [Tolypothrix bouteillei VB521301_2]
MFRLAPHPVPPLRDSSLVTRLTPEGGVGIIAIAFASTFPSTPAFLGYNS